MGAAEDAELETTSPLAPRARPAPGALQQQSTPAPWQSLVAASGGSTQGMAFTVVSSAKRKAADRVAQAESVRNGRELQFVATPTPTPLTACLALNCRRYTSRRLLRPCGLSLAATALCTGCS